MLTISKVFEFSASHTLQNPSWDLATNLERFGKCANPNGHGHNYRLEVTVGGELDPDTSMLIDTSHLQKIVDELVINDLDHRNLNLDVPWLTGGLPTSEVLADSIFERLEAPIKRHANNCALRRVTVWETRKIFAIREG